MKGLFRKDVYVFLKKLKLFLLLIPVFLCGPYAPDSSSFLFLHPGPFALISLVIFAVSCLISMLLYQSREL